jgi:predicted metal-dependent enzyme (double-stranded beta helix superfamily)
MFDLDELVKGCSDAVAAGEGPLAVKELLEQAMARTEQLAAIAGQAPVGLNFVYRGPELTVINAVWPPHVSLAPHNHCMWAVIGVYGGEENNAFYRREGASITPSGGRRLRPRDVLVLGRDAIHAVSNTGHAYCGAVHVYGGDFLGVARSQWNAALEEQPFDFEEVRAEIRRAELQTAMQQA